MDTTTLFYRFGVALAIGLLVGLQREYAKGGSDREIFAGERTLALMGLVGCTAAMVSDVLDSAWAFIGIFLAQSGLVAIAHFVDARRGKVGLTTEVAALVTTLAGALCYWDYLPLAVALAVTTTVLLSLKVEMNTFVQRITREDIYATLKFAVITAIVLPVLPNTKVIDMSPFDVLNPHKIWLMVVFISGISFLGYVLVKIVGSRQGIGLTGLLGGLVSSTAVTLSFSQRSQRQCGLAKPFALAIMISWTVMFSRVVVEVAALNPTLLSVLWLPMAASALAGLGYCVYLYFSQRTDEVGEVQVTNPFELGPAVKFGLIYAVILLVSKAAQMYLGNAGLYLSSVLSGLADVDAITLSVAELSNTSGLPLSVGARAIVLAAMSNTVVKGGIVLMGGARSLRLALLPGFVLMLVAGVGVAFLI
ncbi:MAG: MgtC/SapB family protein [Anaerolineae bacterium]|nr:MgtC/SapB family protein [Anaerolineae bacterium]